MILFLLDLLIRIEFQRSKLDIDLELSKRVYRAWYAWKYEQKKLVLFTSNKVVEGKIRILGLTINIPRKLSLQERNKMTKSLQIMLDESSLPVNVFE